LSHTVRRNTPENHGEIAATASAGLLGRRCCADRFDWRSTVQAAARLALFSNRQALSRSLAAKSCREGLPNKTSPGAQACVKGKQ
jgi:hypothetical protein